MTARKPASSVPLARPIGDALADSAALVRLTEQVRDSRARLAAVSDLLPPPLRAAVQPGPVNELGWALLVTNAAVAAKLRQWVPRLEARLVERGWPAAPIRVKVIPR